MNTELKLDAKISSTWATGALLSPMGLSFSRILANIVDWNMVDCYVCAAKGLSREDIMDFDVGGKVSQNGVSADEWLVRRVSEDLLSSRSYFFSEDWRARPNDPYLTRELMPAVFTGHEVYYVVDRKNVGIGKNWPRICSNSVPAFHAFVIDGGDVPILRSELAESALEKIARHVSAIVLGVYDGESYLYCQLKK